MISIPHRSIASISMISPSCHRLFPRIAVTLSDESSTSVPFRFRIISSSSASTASPPLCLKWIVSALTSTQPSTSTCSVSLCSMYESMITAKTPNAMMAITTMSSSPMISEIASQSSVNGLVRFLISGTLARSLFAIIHYFHI